MERNSSGCGHLVVTLCCSVGTNISEQPDAHLQDQWDSDEDSRLLWNFGIHLHCIITSPANTQSQGCTNFPKI